MIITLTFPHCINIPVFPIFSTFGTYHLKDFALLGPSVRHTVTSDICVDCSLTYFRYFFRKSFPQGSLPFPSYLKWYWKPPPCQPSTALSTFFKFSQRIYVILSLSIPLMDYELHESREFLLFLPHVFIEKVYSDIIKWIVLEYKMLLLHSLSL